MVVGAADVVVVGAVLVGLAVVVVLVEGSSFAQTFTIPCAGKK